MTTRKHWLRIGVLFASGVAGCVPGGPGGSSFTALYPPRPPETPSDPIADPTPARVNMHVTVSGAALKAALEDKLPRTGEGTFPFVGGPRRFTWSREPVAIRFTQGRIGVDLHVVAVADMPFSHLDLPIDLKILAEPVVTSDYVARLQSTEVTVTSNDRLVKVADAAAGILDKVKAEVEGQLKDFAYPMKPLLGEAYDRLAKPIEIPLGDARGCARFKVLGVEAGPTVLADGIEKDLAMVIAPSITVPCAAEEPVPPMPPLANMATLVPGPFTVTVPIAARYDELAKAMSLTFTDGKLYFSKQYPKLFMEKPLVYASKDLLVLKLHISGPVHAMGIDTDLDGDLFMTGHPVVEDNELRIPDLEPTIETSSFLLKLKSALDGDGIRDQARAALRLDISERVKQARSKLSTDLAFGDGSGCFRADAAKIEVTGVHAHAAYLRMYVAVTGTASVFMPCPPSTIR